MRRGGGRAAPGGGRRGGPEPRLRAAARSRQSPPQHRPPRRSGLPLSPRRRLGRCWSGTNRNGRGAPRRRIPPDTLQPGLLLRGGGVAGGEGPAGGRAPGREGDGAPRSGGSGAERPQVPRQPVPSGGSAGQHLTPARGEPRGGRRKRSRRPLLPPPPPLPEPGAPAGEGGEVVPRDFSRPLASRGAGAGPGWGCRAGRLGSEEVWRGGLKSCGLRANHCYSKSCAAQQVSGWCDPSASCCTRSRRVPEEEVGECTQCSTPASHLQEASGLLISQQSGCTSLLAVFSCGCA